MIVYKGNSWTGPSRIVLVFCCGLIGNAIIRQLEWNHYDRLQEYESFWSERPRRRDQYSRISDYLGGLAGNESVEFHFIWSAGSGSFASKEGELNDERDAFRDTADLFELLQPAQSAVFHFISSAGGLFEGQTLVNESSVADPRRPYGEMKRDQEERVRSLRKLPGRKVKIYRPSSVYGAHEFNYRSGLVSHLIWNAIRNHPTALEANVHALRDFVHVDDVGSFIVRQIENGPGNPKEIYTLVSGKPSSIFEIAKRVQKLVGKSLLYRLTSSNPNDADITFCPQIRPDGWKPCDLDYGLHSVLRKTTDAYLHNIPV